jgi:hypothetical protein
MTSEPVRPQNAVRLCAIIFLAGAAIGGAVLARNLLSDARTAIVSVTPYNPDFAGTRGALNVMMARGDGQGMAIMAQDPLLRRSPIDPAETAYRAQRPLVSMVAWAVSLGNRALVPLGIAVSSVLGAGMLSLGAAFLLARYEMNPMWGLAVGILPGATAAVPNGGPETWGLGLVFLGLALWPERRVGAALAFALAGLCRETYLLVPAALAIWGLARNRHLRLELAVPWIAYGAWVVVVHAAVGAWPWDSRTGLAGPPFAGFVDATKSWGEETLANVLVAILFAMLLVTALRKPGPLRPVALAYLGLAIVMGDQVWGRWENFSRALLPAYALGLVALLRDWPRSAATPAPG